MITRPALLYTAPPEPPVQEFAVKVHSVTLALVLTLPKLHSPPPMGLVQDRTKHLLSANDP
jgi:hypothetical protein